MDDVPGSLWGFLLHWGFVRSGGAVGLSKIPMVILLAGWVLCGFCSGVIYGDTTGE